VTEKVTGRLEAVVELLTTTVSDLTAEQAAEVATRAAGGSHTLAALQGHLRDHPDALLSGSSKAPPTVLRLISLLDDAGCDGVVVPRCVDCGQIDRSHRPLGTPVDGGRVCRPCARRRWSPAPDATGVRSSGVERRVGRCANAAGGLIENVNLIWPHRDDLIWPHLKDLVGSGHRWPASNLQRL
jgi:hypothetical protein